MKVLISMSFLLFEIDFVIMNFNEGYKCYKNNELELNNSSLVLLTLAHYSSCIHHSIANKNICTCFFCFKRYFHGIPCFSSKHSFLHLQCEQIYLYPIVDKRKHFLFLSRFSLNPFSFYNSTLFLPL